LGALTAPQRALADLLRLDTGLLTIAAQTSPPLPETKDDPRKLARWIKNLPAGDKDTLLRRVAQGHGAQVQMELPTGDARDNGRTHGKGSSGGQFLTDSHASARVRSFSTACR
jgi:hypothetical protein